MVKSLESKLQHKHQHEILSTFMKITRVNKFKNKTKFNTNIINIMLSTFMKIENHKSKQWSSRHSFQFCILLVWSANGDAPFQGNLLNDDTLPMELCDVILRTNRVRCALNMEILDLLNEESVSGARSSRASL